MADQSDEDLSGLEKELIRHADPRYVTMRLSICLDYMVDTIPCETACLHCHRLTLKLMALARQPGDPHFDGAQANEAYQRGDPLARHCKGCGKLIHEYCAVCEKAWES
jgi:hypothetical protein